MYFADMPASPFYLGWIWRTGWAQPSIAGSKNEGKSGNADREFGGHFSPGFVACCNTPGQ
jgi:hypothetical protein